MMIYILLFLFVTIGIFNLIMAPCTAEVFLVTFNGLALEPPTPFEGRGVLAKPKESVQGKRSKTRERNAEKKESTQFSKSFRPELYMPQGSSLENKNKLVLTSSMLETEA